MRVFLISVLFLNLPAGILTAQSEPVALKILDKFSEKALSAPSVTIEFELRIHDALEESDQTMNGVVYIKNGFYKLQLPDNIIWSNGKTVWTLAPEVEEVTITVPDKEETFYNDPVSLFTIYKEGYKQKVIEATIAHSIIDLYPEDIESDFSRIRLLIDNSNNLKEAEYKRKDGLTMFIIVKSYDLKKVYQDSFFEFDQSKFRNVDIIDMRK